MTAGIANIEMAKAWDGEQGEHWARHADRYDATISRYASHLVAGARLDTTDIVLDIGCGCGASTRDAARAVQKGSVLGVDLSAKMLARARVSADREGLSNIRFEQADVQVYPFETATVDVAISRFGGMFFADPVAAYSNVGRAVRPGGRLAMLSWQPLENNEWFAVFRETLAMGRDLPSPVPGQPGAFGLADPEEVADLLGAAGFRDVNLEAITEPARFGDNPDDAYAFAVTIGPATALLADLDETQKAEALEHLRASIEEHDTGDGVCYSSAAWLITARLDG